MIERERNSERGRGTAEKTDGKIEKNPFSRKRSRKSATKRCDGCEHPTFLRRVRVKNPDTGKFEMLCQGCAYNREEWRFP